MNKIALIGLGNFGTALARNWIDHGLQVKGWTVEEEVFRSIKKTGAVSYTHLTLPTICSV